VTARAGSAELIFWRQECIVDYIELPLWEAA
jgi:hypothetical protein